MQQPLHRYDRFVRPSACEPAKERHNADLFITLKGFVLGLGLTLPKTSTLTISRNPQNSLFEESIW